MDEQKKLKFKFTFAKISAGQTIRGEGFAFGVTLEAAMTAAQNGIVNTLGDGAEVMSITEVKTRKRAAPASPLHDKAAGWPWRAKE